MVIYYLWWKESMTLSWIKNLFLTWVFLLLYFSCIVSHNSQVLLYLNVHNPLIEHLDISWKYEIIWYVNHQGNNTQGCEIVINLVDFFSTLETPIKNAVSFWIFWSCYQRSTIIWWYRIRSSYINVWIIRMNFIFIHNNFLCLSKPSWCGIVIQIFKICQFS